MFEVRDNEPDYAILKDNTCQEQNCYGKPVDTVPAEDELRDASLNINDDHGIGDNPNRYKQHGFYFNADNCIACHACEAACSEKNDNPAHIAFRSVGFVEGGTYPDYQRINISMACNHCDDPVCLKGCPTRAYTKFAEYGAVLQDPDICFGCGYCTWVCPYNAPQLDPVQGQVSKCNMCVDRLEVGLKPACVSACLGNALDFGVIENIPERRTQAKTEIPGFPRTDITHPNIRFQQTRTTQRDMARADSAAVKYHRDDNSSEFRPAIDPGRGFKREWNLDRLLGSHENAHIAFTLSVQAVMGAFVVLLTGVWDLTEATAGFTSGNAFLPTLGLLVILMGIGLYKLNMHLGKPHRFYRGFYNLRLSPVSREIAGVSLFFTGLAGFTFFSIFEESVSLILSHIFVMLALTGVAVGGYYMYKLYRIPARPFWDHWHTAASFTGSGLYLGALLIMISGMVFGVMTPQLVITLSAIIAAGLLLEAAGIISHAYDMKRGSNEGAVSYYEQTTTYAYPYWLRNSALLTGLLISIGVVMTGSTNVFLAGGLAAALLVTAVPGRAMFYVLVIPTTMPGGFFWKNRGFVEHAREVGLADMPQVGVVHEGHHAFKLNELLASVRETSTQDKLSQLKAILSWR